MADTPPTDDLHRPPTGEDFGRLEWTTVDYYLKEVNPVNGLVRDKTEPNAPSSIAAVGMFFQTGKARTGELSDLESEYGCTAFTNGAFVVVRIGEAVAQRYEIV